MKIVHAVGARPNFMKMAPIIDAFARHNSSATVHQTVDQVLVHTGQHYDRAMSSLFFEQLGLPKPHIDLGVGSGPHGQQTGRIMEAFERVLIQEQPDLLLVVGDVNSTIACTLDAVKLGIPVAHVEAGLRSFDRSMPEEINRVLTDAIADLLLTTERSASDNLTREGIDPARVFFVGNVMIDSLFKHLPTAKALPTLLDLGLADENGVIDYALATLHRPANVDNLATLSEISCALSAIGSTMPVVFPVHPRTRQTLSESGLDKQLVAAGVLLLEPASYLDFLNLQSNARIVLTDSGGVQEETTVLGIPCLTLRPNTERPVTISHGTNVLVPDVSTASILNAFESGLAMPKTRLRTPELWDGNAAERVVRVIIHWLCARSGVAS